MKTACTAIRLLLLLTLLTGALYPAVVTGIAQLMPRQAGGSLVHRAGKPVGSALLAQAFASEKYVHPRPSAGAYATVSSGASNLGVTNRKRVDEAAARAAAWTAAGNTGDAPAEMRHTSGSGLDPHLTPAAALAQLPRVAAARGWDASRLERARLAVASLTEGPALGFLGPDRVNVLLLNLALDAL